MPGTIVEISSVHPTAGYNHAARAGNLLFVAGQVAKDREGHLVGAGDFETQAMQTFENLRSVVEEAGGQLSDIVKKTTYLTHFGHIEMYRAVRDRFFSDPMPPNTLVVVDSLADPRMLIEVEAIAALD